jgi:uncharacterized protein YjiS (DUF1127 family)
VNAFAQLGLRDYHPIVGRSIVRRGSWQDAFRRMLRRWRAHREERRALASLSERDFHDMGRTRSELEYQVAKPFWRD